MWGDRLGETGQTGTRLWYELWRTIMQVWMRPKLAAQIDRLFASGVRAETALGIAMRFKTDEEAVLDHLFIRVARGELEVLEEGSLQIFVTPEYARLLELAELAA